MNTFFIEGKQGRIEVAHDKVKDARQDVVAVICHPHPLYQGSMHNKVVTTIARAMKTFKVESYRFNYRGVGDSQGEYGEGLGELEDLLTVCKWIEQNTSIKKIVLCGFSFGGAIAYKGLSKIDKVLSLITIAPAVDRFDLTKYPAPNLPWFLVQGVDDDIVNPESVFDFAINKVESDLIMLKMNKVGHFFHGRLTDLKKNIENFVFPILDEL
ncbi:alpha/beta fold hydrolase [Allofrancisella guangzhouensis]|uniref:Alpha/beta hydrolase n=1 Tax=Allofrancisella guangzhouensis TaxID=594679 RepID=A0A0A8E363_9GAMM|nr:alpha/beta fold hydrolase [Allofrancisella guangzhouensis]AJC48645.1 alpha/beta hydrolase [Allofrancisella guangzhouensis]MBK2026967.1 alpha/beta fold hydrolase [Allofrancisella guangzhouensis]MBK2044753.1 alpha/beta fold hydrolase [Allofrancisella guangzhouensis]MBK2045867.1 alpha/beta fold hydrolase [Allofrancisella guangzhouensis]